MTGFVYAIERGNLVKIGWSHKPLDRLVQIRAKYTEQCHLLGVRAAPSASYERAYHTIFSEWRDHGEWFRKEGDVLDFIGRLQPLPSGSAPSDALTMAKEFAGGSVKLARLLKVTSQAIGQWRRVPADRVLAVERATGVARHELRPDIYPPQTQAEPMEAAQ